MENMITRVRNILMVAVSVVLVAGLSVASPKPKSTAKPRTVFLKLTGDEKLVGQLSTLIVRDLEAAGIAVSATEKDADIIVSGKLTQASKRDSIETGTVQFGVSSKQGAVTETACASLSPTKEDDLFQGTLLAVPKELRKKYPAVTTVSVDPQSSLSLSKSFGPDFIAGLTRAGFHVVESDADLNVKIDLTVKDVGIREDVMHYKLEMAGRSTESSNTVLKGDSILSAESVDTPPSVCADRFTDLSWLADRNALQSLARDLVGQIRQYKQ